MKEETHAYKAQGRAGNSSFTTASHMCFSSTMYIGGVCVHKHALGQQPTVVILMACTTRLDVNKLMQC